MDWTGPASTKWGYIKPREPEEVQSLAVPEFLVIYYEPLANDAVAFRKIE